jgi:hypothetical protein
LFQAPSWLAAGSYYPTFYPRSVSPRWIFGPCSGSLLTRLALRNLPLADMQCAQSSLLLRSLLGGPAVAPAALARRVNGQGDEGADVQDGRRRGNGVSSVRRCSGTAVRCDRAWYLPTWEPLPASACACVWCWCWYWWRLLSPTATHPHPHTRLSVVCRLSLSPSTCHLHLRRCRPLCIHPP